MTTSGPVALDETVVQRYQELTRRALGLRRGGLLAGPPLLLVIGALGIAGGLLLVVLGYLGASHTIYVFEQIPYLISGGILGGCLVVAGGLTYFGFWLTKVHAANERAVASMERMERLLETLVERSAP